MRSNAYPPLICQLVSPTSIVYKFLEDIIVDKVLDYLEVNNFFKSSHHRSRRYHSCLIYLLKFFQELFTKCDQREELNVI